MRKKLLAKIKARIFFFAFLAPLIFSSFVLAQETIRSFDVQAQIQENSSALITEDILYDFSLDYKHGIYRDIYAKDISISVKSVVDENGNKYKYDLSKINDSIRVKIGDPDKTISGTHHYIITYLVKGAVKFLPDHDEFYWNVTGNNWLVPIEKTEAVVSIWGDFSDKAQLKCYTGAFGATGQDCLAQIKPTGAVETTTAFFQTTRPLQVGEGLTIVFGWPKGAINPPSTLEKLGDIAKKYWPFSLPVITFICLFIVWWKKGRDIKLHRSIVVQYDLPSDLRPVEVAYILNQKIVSRDISAMIVDLAVKGYLKIKETEKKHFIGKSKDWLLIKQKNFSSDQALEPYEHYLLSNLFTNGDEVAVSSLKEKFYKTYEEIEKDVSKEMVIDDYFVEDPNKIKKRYYLMGIICLVGVFVLAKMVGSVLFSSFLNYGLLLLMVVLSGIIFLIFSVFMPKKTKKGTETLWHILGFKEYITRAEKYRAQFQEKENIFEKFLPYAIIFGCTKKWAKAFEGIYKTPPTWYEGAVYGAYFSPVNFAKSFDSSMAAIGTALAAKPGGGSGSSGFGGGFSGGGFGGGGGGSW